jgi:endonuclease/exonuclease/phosphatase (EEP) superfamily protein YafD
VPARQSHPPAPSSAAGGRAWREWPLLALAAAGAAWCGLGLLGDGFVCEVAAASSLHVAIALAMLTLALRRRRLAPAIALVGVVMGCARWTTAAYEVRAPAATAHPALVVAVANVYTLNRERGRAIEAALAPRPDLVCLLETGRSDQADFASVGWLPHQVWDESNVGIALLSALPFDSQRIHSEVRPPFIEAVVHIGEEPVEVIACHVASPTSERAERTRQETMAAIAKTIAGHPGPVLVLGDLNLAVGSPLWSRLRDQAGLSRPTAHEPATWPAVLGPFGIGIDHVLGRGLGIDPPRALVLPGSDHRGLVTRVALAPRAEPR